MLSSSSVAAEIMGTSFVGPDDIRGMSVRIVDMDELVPWSPSALDSYKNSHILAFVPAISIAEMSDSGFGRRFLDLGPLKKELFATQRPQSGWHLVQKTPVPNSGNKWWLEQKSLLKISERVPKASVVTFLVIAYFQKTGLRLFERDYVRTDDVCEGRQRVSFCAFNEESVHYNIWPEFDCGHLKLAAEIVPEI